jgi:phospholipid/cholesterol/gamma-HCH transport system permease protein
MSRQPSAELASRDEDGFTVLTPRGEWTVETIGAIASEVREIEHRADHGKVVIELNEIERIDTSGAFLLGRTIYECAEPNGDWHYRGDHPTARKLIEETVERAMNCEPEMDQGRFGFVRAAERVGLGLEAAWEEAISTFAFLGKTLIVFASTVARPWRFRLTPIFYVMEEAGVNALPIIAVLSFFIGAVVAFMGANLLETFGASVFTVELVGLAVLREFGVLITAIMLAGRSDSAFTAAIGSMKMQQEIDAMKVLGIDPFEALVIPRVIACVIMAPLLAFAGVLAGLLGGLLVCWSALDISPAFFVSRLQDTIDISHFWVGMSKAPIFGLIIAIVGCKQGLEVGGDVESLGRNVTASVVQSIFAVIIVDAMFAMMYLELGI